MSIRFAVTVDTECDREGGWGIKYPLSFESVWQGIPDLLQPIFARHAVRPTYLLSPEVIESNECVRTLRNLNGDCELGAHLHGEFVAPQQETNPGQTACLQCCYPSDLEYAKIRSLTILFEKKFGYRPKCFRAGRFAASGRTMKFLEELGYLVDTSVTPFTIWRDQMGRVDFRGAPLLPYFPSVDDITVQGNSKVLEVPVTILPGMLSQHLGRCFAFLKRRRFSKRVWRRLFGNVWLRPSWATADEMISLVNKCIARTGNNAILNMMFHSVEAIPGASPYSRTVQDVEKMLGRLEKVLAFLRQKGARSATPSQLYEDHENLLRC